MKNMKTIIQFPHPGGEHDNKSGVIWNNGVHKRKYMKIKGTYLQNLESKPIENTLYFWGEWEAPSTVTVIAGNISPLPKFIFEPCFTLNVPKDAANTDPFVFGSPFYYCICKQGHYSSLRNLEKGSIILFGSYIEENFVLDTLFVIKQWKDYKINEIPSLKDHYKNDAFYHVSLEPIINSQKDKCKGLKKGIGCACGCEEDTKAYNPVEDVETYRIYESVMYEDRKLFDGMFSYAPCLPYEIGKFGFARPIINTPIIIEPKLKQGLKITTIYSLWKDFTKQVINQGLNLMVKNNLPRLCTNLKNQ